MGAHVEAHRKGLPYEGWTEALGQRFFRSEYRGLHVMFFVDESCLSDLSDLDHQEAVASLRDAVRLKLSRYRPHALFGRIARETRDWKRRDAEGFPPSLPLLGLCVLAATRMGRTKERAGHNYYAPFVELLDLDGVAEEEVIDSYGADVPWLWRNLRWWLDEHHRGELGLSTIEEHRHWTRIGWADSQTLFTSSDRDKLTQFFEWMGYRPGDEIHERELLLHFRRWALGREDLSASTEVMLEDDVYPQQLAEVLQQAAKRWEGIVRDEDGSFVAEIALTFHLAPPRLGVAAPRPRGFPEAVTVATPFAAEIDLQVDELALDDDRQWYDGLDFEVTTSMLERGLTLRSGQFVLRLPPYHLHILRKSAELGCWASHSLLRPEEPAWLLVRGRIFDRVMEYLGSAGASDAAPIEREGVVPRGWRLIRDVFLPADAPTPPEGLGRLKPRVSNRMGLVGGLPIVTGREYLTGGEPDLQLPGDEIADEVTVELDGEPRVVRDGLLRLRGQLRPGPHEVRLEGVPRHFLVHDTLGRLTPAVDAEIRHLAAAADSTCEAMTFGAKVEDGANASVRIVGAAIDCAVSDALEPPIVLPAAASEVTLVGSVPGQLERVTPPGEPRWITDLNKDQPRLHLGYRVFEHRPEFPVVWIARTYHLGPRVRLAAELAPAREPSDSEATLDDWCAFFRGHESPPGNPALWDEYRETAERLAR